MISVISPMPKSHEAYIGEAYASLCRQTVETWEWIIVENSGGKVPEEIAKDGRVKIVPYKDAETGHNSIGDLKLTACRAAAGDIILELDADDILLPLAMERAIEAFKDDAVQFAYSNNADFNEKWESRSWSGYWGWRKRPFSYAGHELWEMRDFPPSPQAFRLIYWSPDHFKAWRKKAYDEVGGHDPKMLTGDDHDLVCRFFVRYGAAGFKHLDECLYLYRMHKDNSCVVHNAEVQRMTHLCYEKYLAKMAERWADDGGLKKIDLGGCIRPTVGYTSLDIRNTADVQCDLNERWPLADNSVGVLRAVDIVEHLKNPIFTMNEAYRVLTPGGFMFIEVPSTDGRGAFQDPTHVSFWNENSIWYYTDANYARFIRPQFNGRFQASKILTTYPSKWSIDHKVPIVKAELICLKEPYDSNHVGEKLI